MEVLEGQNHRSFFRDGNETNRFLNRLGKARARYLEAGLLFTTKDRVKMPAEFVEKYGVKVIGQEIVFEAGVMEVLQRVLGK